VKLSNRRRHPLRPPKQDEMPPRYDKTASCSAHPRHQARDHFPAGHDRRLQLRVTAHAIALRQKRDVITTPPSRAGQIRPLHAAPRRHRGPSDMMDGRSGPSARPSPNGFERTPFSPMPPSRQRLLRPFREAAESPPQFATAAATR